MSDHHFSCRLKLTSHKVDAHHEGYQWEGKNELQPITHDQRVEEQPHCDEFKWTPEKSTAHLSEHKTHTRVLYCPGYAPSVHRGAIGEDSILNRL
jgi:hypothetical protein